MYTIISRNTKYLELIQQQTKDITNYKLVIITDDDYCNANKLSAICKKLKLSSYDTVIICEEINIFLEQLAYSLMLEKIAPVFIVKQFMIQKLLPFSLSDMSTGYYIECWDKPFISHLETHINDYCNLNCKACNNYAPFFEKGSVSNLESFSADLETLRDNFCMIGRLYLLGGEPLLEPALCMDFVSEARNILPFTEIRLLTNGLLIPKMNNQFWESIRKNNIIIQVTQYPPTAKIIHEIKNTLEKQHILNIISDKVVYFMKRQTLSNHEDSEYNNMFCPSRGCHYFRDGKIYKCPDTALVKNFDNYFNSNLYANEGMNINTFETGIDLLNSIFKPCKMCSVCTIKRQRPIKWESAGTPLQKNDWAVKDKNSVIKIAQELINNSVICFGAGKQFNDMQKNLSSHINISYVCDNDPSKWDTNVANIKCISPTTLRDFQNPYILITVVNPEIVCSIETQLKNMGIENYLTIQEFWELEE